VTGPELDRSERACIEHAVRPYPGADVREFTNDMMSYMNAADAVVCMGGYNTICEVASMGKRAIVVPRVRPVEEQLIRADRLSRRRLVTLLHPDTMTPQTLGDSVLEALDPECRIPHASLDLDALPRITNYIGGLHRRENVQDAPTPTLVYRAPDSASIARDTDARQRP
jgi:predicted glycosyltransferase